MHVRLMLALLLSGLTLCAFGQQSGLLVDAADSSFTRAVVPDVAIRARAVVINAAALPTANARAGDGVRLNLFEDVTFDVVLEALSVRTNDQYTWAGRIVGDASSSVTIAVRNDVLQANVHTPEHGTFQIRYVADGLHHVYEIDPTKFGECVIGPEHAVSPAPAPRIRPPAGRGTANIADVLVVYTPAARIAVGGTAAMEALIDLAIVESNDAYAFSIVDFALNLAGTFEVDYSEGSGFSAALSSLRSLSDGIMDEVHPAREAVGADFVSLIINNPSSCGIGYVMTSLAGNFSGLAFSVEHYSCATGNFSFAHELGHNMGAQHDLENAPSGGLFLDSIGWHWGNSTNPGYDGSYRSIMAYAPGQRVQRFSNPDVDYAGEPTGLLNVANNAQTLNTTAPIAAAWRATAAWITVLPNNGVSSEGEVGGPFTPSSLTFTLTNLDSAASTWTASSSQPWATVTPNSGALAAGASTTVTVSFGAAANALDSGTHTAALTFIDVSNGKSFQYTAILTAVGEPGNTIQYYFPMNTDPGWTREALWQFGVPLGLGSNNPDPTSGYTGANVFGYNLAGDYPDNMIERPMTTTAIDCSNLQNVWLTFWRWLGVESSTWDHAKIQASNNGIIWTDIWVHNGPDIAETAWSQQSYDISSIADGQNTVYVRWVMGTADSGVTFSGWNIDDVAIVGDPITPVLSDDVWVNFAYVGAERGTQALPYTSVGEGAAYVNPGGTVHVLAGTSSEALTLSEPMTIVAEGGMVQVGLNAR